MTRTEWNWLLGKPTHEAMIVIDDGVLAMFDEYIKKKCAEAFQRGAEAMKQAAICMVGSDWDADLIRTLKVNENDPPAEWHEP